VVGGGLFEVVVNVVDVVVVVVIVERDVPKPTRNPSVALDTRRVGTRGGCCSML
jgi:hypothetical protein